MESKTIPITEIVGQSPEIEKYIFILNPTAGKHKALELKELIQQKFIKENAADKCIFYITERPGHATQLARESAGKFGNKAIIYACGGDGTVNEVANGIIGTESVLSVIPAGTGNDFIKTLYSVKTSDEVIENIFNYKLKKIDSPMLDSIYYVNMSSLGFDTIVGDRAKEMVAKAKFLGGSSYFLAIFVCLFGKNYSKMKYTFTCVDENGNESVVSETKEFVLAALANGEYYGGMFHPCPNADMSDGLVDVCIVDRISIPKILAMIPRYIKGTHMRHPAVHMLKVKSGVMEGVGEELHINCDGESFRKASVTLSINPSCLTVAYY